MTTMPTTSPLQSSLPTAFEAAHPTRALGEDPLSDEALTALVGASASPLPVLLVIADQQDFYHRGGWGSSMYQYAS